MGIKTKKIPIEISTKGTQCNNCYWMHEDKEEKVRCSLFNFKKLKKDITKNWYIPYTRCKRCVYTFK